MKVLYRLLAVINVVLFLFSIGVGILLGVQDPSSISLYALHFKLSLGASVMTLFIHSMVMIYFIVTHKAVKEGLDLRNLTDNDYRRRMRQLKMETIPWTTLGMLIMIGATIMGAAVDTGNLPRWTHSTSVLFAIAVNVYLFLMTYEKLEENTALLHEANDLMLVHDDEAVEPEKGGKGSSLDEAGAN